VTVDYASSFIEVDYLPDTLAETIIAKMKHPFARYGVPDTVVSDGGPQYTSTSFKHFSDSWQFKHFITSPGNSKANGAAEAAVKSVKKLMRKCIAAHEDPYLGLLNLRNTPVEGINLSPTQLMFGRQTKSTLPTTVQNLAPSIPDPAIRKKKEDKRAKIANHLDQNRSDLRELKVGASSAITTRRTRVVPGNSDETIE